MFKNFFKKKQERLEAVNKARENYVAWTEIANSPGWKVYCQVVDKKVENIKKRMEEDSTLTGEDLKRLQLALAVWREVMRLPKELEQIAKGK